MVKITFKTVQNKPFTIDAEESETVVDLKKRIQESQTFPAELQKLIYSGKILQDAATIGSLNIKEKDFLVVMVSKVGFFGRLYNHLSDERRAQPKAAPAAPTPAPIPVLESAPPVPEPAPEAASTPAQAAPQAGGSSAPQGGSFITGPELQSAISSMVEMGFERDQVMKALRASFNNPDRAVEYLMNGHIPETEALAPPPAPPAAPAAAPAPAPVAVAPAPVQPAAAPVAAPPAGGAGAENLFAAAEAAMNRDRGTPAGGAPGGGAGLAGLAGMGDIINSPQLQRVREMVQQNPALLQPLLQEIASANPQLAQAINENPQALYELLGGGGDGDDDDEYGGQQVMQVNLTQDEAAAVERLEALGFDRQMVLQAYMLCDKNEELAANFLFDNGDEDQ
ncbi:UV excision repair protein RAD23, partial [Tremellales sp. Uapishka_1]